MERPVRRTIGRKPAPARPPEPTGTPPAECFERSVSPEDFDGRARHRVDIEERLMLWGLKALG
jgi:hypothetical protein